VQLSLQGLLFSPSSHNFINISSSPVTIPNACDKPEQPACCYNLVLEFTQHLEQGIADSYIWVIQSNTCIIQDGTQNL